MLSFFKSNKYSPATVNSTYYIRECLIHNVDDLNLILQADLKEFTLIAKTDVDLEIKNLPLIGLTEKKLIVSLKQPIYIFDNSDDLKGHKVLFYKEDVGFYRFLLQFHFMDGVFFFASNRVSSSGLLPEAEKNKIIHQILNRYSIKTEEEYKDFHLMITDENDSVLTTIDEVYFNVNYLCGGETKNNMISRFSGQKDQKNQKSDFDSNVDKYF